MYFPKKPKFFSISAAKTLKMSFVYNYVYSSVILEKSPTSTEMRCLLAGLDHSIG